MGGGYVAVVEFHFPGKSGLFLGINLGSTGFTECAHFGEVGRNKAAFQQKNWAEIRSNLGKF